MITAACVWSGAKKIDAKATINAVVKMRTDQRASISEKMQNPVSLPTHGVSRNRRLVVSISLRGRSRRIHKAMEAAVIVAPRVAIHAVVMIQIILCSTTPRAGSDTGPTRGQGSTGTGLLLRLRECREYVASQHPVMMVGKCREGDRSPVDDSGKNGSVSIGVCLPVCLSACLPVCHFCQTEFGRSLPDAAPQAPSGLRGPTLVAAHSRRTKQSEAVAGCPPLPEGFSPRPKPGTRSVRGQVCPSDCGSAGSTWHRSILS